MNGGHRESLLVQKFVQLIGAFFGFNKNLKEKKDVEQKFREIDAQ